MSGNRSYDDLDILEDMKKQIYDAIKEKKDIPKLGDLLKVIDMKRKMSVEGKGEKKFWEMVDRIRTEELASSGTRRLAKRGKKKCSSE